MTRIAAARGFDLSRHTAAQVTADDLAWADEILVMDDENLRQLAGSHPRLAGAGRLRLLDPGGIPDRGWSTTIPPPTPSTGSSGPSAPTWPASAPPGTGDERHYRHG